MIAFAKLICDNNCERVEEARPSKSANKTTIIYWKSWICKALLRIKCYTPNPIISNFKSLYFETGTIET